MDGSEFSFFLNVFFGSSFSSHFWISETWVSRFHITRHQAANRATFLRKVSLGNINFKARLHLYNLYFLILCEFYTDFSQDLNRRLFLSFWILQRQLQLIYIFFNVVIVCQYLFSQYFYPYFTLLCYRFFIFLIYLIQQSLSNLQIMLTVALFKSVLIYYNR